jgi:hypothetical protein
MLDVAQNRRAKKYTSDEMTRRVLWTLAQPLFSVQSTALFWLEAISASLFRSEDWP